MTSYVTGARKGLIQIVSHREPISPSLIVRTVSVDVSNTEEEERRRRRRRRRRGRRGGRGRRRRRRREHRGTRGVFSSTSA